MTLLGITPLPNFKPLIFSFFSIFFSNKLPLADAPINSHTTSLFVSRFLFGCASIWTSDLAWHSVRPFKCHVWFDAMSCTVPYLILSCLEKISLIPKKSSVSHFHSLASCASRIFPSFWSSHKENISWIFFPGFFPDMWRGGTDEMFQIINIATV